MEPIQLTPVTGDDQVQLVASLAQTIWRQHFTPIIGGDQVEYMLEKFQSYAALKQQLEEGYQYFLLSCGDKAAGYSGVVGKDGGLFLSKLYVLQGYRGRGIGKAAIDFYEGLCVGQELPRIWLTCNRDNADTLAAYGRLGFKIVREQVSDIGGGYVMDDYILEKSIS